MVKTTKRAWVLRLTLLILGTLVAAACAQPNSPSAVATSPGFVLYRGTTADTVVAADSSQVGNGAVFTTASVATPGTTTFTVKNPGTATLTGVVVKVPSGKFAVSTAAATSVEPGASTSFAITYTPTAVGTESATVSVANSATTTFTFTLTVTTTATPTSGLAVSTSVATLAPGDTADLGNAPLGTATPLTLTIQNVGTAALSGLAASVADTAGTGEFAVTKAPADTVAVGASTTFEVSLTPAKTATGVRTGTLTITHSAGTFALAVKGTGIVNSKVYYVTIPGSPLTSAQNAANFANGTFLTFNSYGSTSNNFYYTAPNYYARAAQSFLMFPTAMTGDFSISATILDLGGNASANSGMAIGMTSGFAATDKYAYALMNNGVANSTPALSAVYVSASATITNTNLSTLTPGATATFATATSGSVTNASGTLTSTLAGTATPMVFSRSGNTLNLGVSTGTLAGLDATKVTDGATTWGTSPMYPCLAFVRNYAQITNLVIKDAGGNVVYDSAFGGGLGTYYPAAVSLSATSVNANVGATTTVTATANDAGYDAAGLAAAVTAASSNTAVATVAVTGSTITVTGVAAGTATVAVTNTADPTKTASFAVTITAFATSDPAYGLSSTTAYPAPGASDAYTDGELSLTFDAAPTLVSGGLIKIYKASDGTEADSIAFAGEVQNVPTSATTTTAINVGTQLVRVDAATKRLYITPHFGKLAYGTKYYVGIPTNTVTGTINGVTFTGFSNASSVATWNFTTRAAPTLTATITVDGSQTSTAQFRTLGGALMALVLNPPAASAITINVAAGTYVELVQYRPATADLTKTITIQGPTSTAGSLGGDTVIQYTNGGSMNATQQMRASFYFAGANLVLQNLTLKNTGVRATVAQAEALYFDSRIGSTLAANNCSFISNQDTINTTGRNWFYKCFVQGNTDFIWGTADAALFENCSLRVFNDGGTLSSPFALMVARTNAMTTAGAYSTTAGTGFTGVVGKGYVLLNSTVAVDDGCTAVFARDAGTGTFYDQVAVINNTFSATASSGTIGTGLWTVTTAPLSLGDSTYVGWKATGNTGLNLASLSTATGTTATVAALATEYDTRAHILNNVVSVTAGAPTGFVTSPLGTWDVSALAATFGAP
jgi:hypothetical protein